MKKLSLLPLLTIFIVIMSFSQQEDTNNKILPIYLLKFNGSTTVNNQGAQLNWSTNEQIDYEYIEVERSNTTTNFVAIERFYLGSIVYNGIDCKYIDKLAHQGLNFYRLKFVSKNGTKEYSIIVKVNIDPVESTKIHPNPITNSLLNIKLSKFWIDKKVIVSVYDKLGQKILSKGILNPQQTNSINLNSISNVICILKFEDENNNIETLKVVILK